MNKFLLIISLWILTFFTDCNNFLNLQPIDSPTEGNFYADEGGLQGALTSCYDALQNEFLYGNNFLALAENRGDNVADNNISSGGGVIYQIDAFTDRSDNKPITDTWLQLYIVVFRCNMVIERAPGIKMSAAVRNQIVGQALFIRALAYFNITRLWGKAPLITKIQTPDEARNNKRSEISDIYQQVISDLKDAIRYLPDTWPPGQKGRASSFSSRALLAKAYLYQGKFDLAVSALQPLVSAIYDSKGAGLVPQTSTFPNSIKTSADVLFAVQYLAGGVGEGIHQNNRYRFQDGSIIITIDQNLFETGDNRKGLLKPPGGGVERPEKFNSAVVSNNETSGDMPVLRCAEALLIYAEALNELGYPNADAFKAINAVRANAGLSPLDANAAPTQAHLKNAIWKERRLELALECDRWFDIVRTGQFPAIYPLVPAFKVLYAIPQTEINNINDKTGWQNDGYEK